MALLPPTLLMLSFAAVELISGCGTAASLRGRGLFVIFMAAIALAGISCTLDAELADFLPFWLAVPLLARSGSSFGALPFCVAGVDALEEAVVVLCMARTDGSCGGQMRSQSGCMVDVITSGSACTLPGLLRTVPVLRAFIRRSSSKSTSSNRSAAALRAEDVPFVTLATSGLAVLVLSGSGTVGPLRWACL